MRINRGAIILLFNRWEYSLRRRFWTKYTNFLNFIDPLPARKKHETIPNYVLRLNKRQALRELNRAIGVTYAVNLESLNYMLHMNLDKQSREAFELMKDSTERRSLYRILREQIRNSEG